MTHSVSTDTPEEPDTPGVSRRGLLSTALLAGAGGLAVGAAGGAALTWSRTEQPQSDTDKVNLTRSYPFYDQPHPAGVATEPQRNCVFMTFNVAPGASRQDLQTLLARWSAAAAVLQEGHEVGSVQPTNPNSPPADTGETFGLSPASLTVTFGLGPTLFDGRFGLEGKRPAVFQALPSLNGDDLDPLLTGGDLSVQACADDPQVCYHATRNLARIGRRVVTPHWMVLGFGRASAGPGQSTPRNLLGFKDGTRNISTPEEYDKFVWVTDRDQPWMNGGSYQAVRKIRMLMETWDTDRVGNQQDIFGRFKESGAPLSGKKEFDTPDFAAKNSDGDPVIDPRAHIALAAHENNDGIMIRRRSYNYTDGLDATGQLNAGLLFIAYMNDPAHFVTLQNRLGAHDLLNEYIRHIGSGLFAVPPSPEVGHYVGQALFS